MKTLRVAVILLSISMPSVAQTNQVTIHVSAPLRDGFVDTSKDIQDSVKDLRDHLDKKVFLIVDNKDKADIILTVVTRGVGSQAYGQRLVYKEYFGNATLDSVPIVANTYWVTTVMDIGTYRMEFAGSRTQSGSASLGAWTVCAEQIAKNLKAWAQANSSQIKDRRKP